jgi:hypothetical protein
MLSVKIKVRGTAFGPDQQTALFEGSHASDPSEVNWVAVQAQVDVSS